MRNYEFPSVRCMHDNHMRFQNKRTFASKLVKTGLLVSCWFSVYTNAVAMSMTVSCQCMRGISLVPWLSARAFKFKQYVISMLLFFGGHPVQAIQLTSNRQLKNSLITICLYKSKVHCA